MPAGGQLGDPLAIPRTTTVRGPPSTDTLRRGFFWIDNGLTKRAKRRKKMKTVNESYTVAHYTVIDVTCFKLLGENLTR